MDWIYGKTVLITGASSGIGRSLASELIRNHNCKVIGIGQSEDKMKDFVSELTYLRDSFTYRIFDVSNEDNWITFSREVRDENMSIDILINNAGMLPAFNKAVYNTDEKFKEVMDINFNSCRYSIKAMLPYLRKSTMPGIINVTSADVLAPLVGTSMYSASKAALKAYTEVLIGELGREMYIAYVCPGYTRTDIFRNQYTISNNRTMKFISTKPEKMANKIIKKIIKQKARIIVGKDAKFMNFTSKFFPVLGLKFYEILLKKTKLKMFENIK